MTDVIADIPFAQQGTVVTKRADRHPASALRICAAMNLAKAIMLGEEHEPGNPQTIKVAAFLDQSLNRTQAIGDATWCSWFKAPPPEVKITKIQLLDLALGADTVSLIKRGFTRLQAGRGFITELALGGLISSLLAANQAKRTTQWLRRQAERYLPLSPWHLLMDAVDAIAFTGKTCGSDWAVVKRIASMRILELLFDRWNGRDGWIYRHLKSDFRIEWEKASIERRQAMEESFSKVRPNLFEREMRRGAWPRRELIERFRMPATTDVPSILMNVARDGDFLVEDRFAAWALDFAVALLTMHAYGNADGNQVLGTISPLEETHWMKGSRALLFGKDPTVDDLLFEFGPIGPMEGDHEGLDAFARLIDGRTFFHSLLRLLNIAPQELEALTENQWKAHPAVLIG